jgi:hypothetical protein
MNFRTFLTIGALFIATPVTAHEMAKGPNGGRVVEAGDYHVELVVKDNVLDVFLTDSGEKPVPAKGFKAVAVLVTGGKSQRIVLAPAGDGRLSGRVSAALPEQPQGAVLITAPDGKTAQARFN